MLPTNVGESLHLFHHTGVVVVAVTYGLLRWRVLRFMGMHHTVLPLVCVGLVVAVVPDICYNSAVLVIALTHPL